MPSSGAPNKVIKTHYFTKALSYICIRPWRPIRLWEVEASIFSRPSAHRWRWGCQSYSPSAFYTPERFLVLISVRGWSSPAAHSAAWNIKSIEKSNDLNGIRTRDLLACSIVPQSTKFPRYKIIINFKTFTTVVWARGEGGAWKRLSCE
jgi:hypothetical protein